MYEYFMPKNDNVLQNVNKIYIPICISSHQNVKMSSGRLPTSALFRHCILKMEAQLLTKREKDQNEFIFLSWLWNIPQPKFNQSSCKDIEHSTGSLKTWWECQPASVFRLLSVCGRVIIYIGAWWSDGERKERDEKKKGLMNNTPGSPTCQRLRLSEEFKEERWFMVSI